MQKLGSVFMGSKGFFVNCTFHTLQRINEYNIEHRKILDMIRAAGPAIEHTSVDFLIRSQSAGFSVVVCNEGRNVLVCITVVNKSNAIPAKPHKTMINKQTVVIDVA
jgi:hypothetical protein